MIEVGLEKVGISRSIRALSGAVRMAGLDSEALPPDELPLAHPATRESVTSAIPRADRRAELLRQDELGLRCMVFPFSGAIQIRRRAGTMRPDS